MGGEGTTMSELKFRAFLDGDKSYFTFEDLICYVGDLFHESRGDAKLYEFLYEGNQPDRYTGCKDKNGIEIYENDIVCIDYSTAKTISLVHFGNHQNEFSHDVIGFYIYQEGYITETFRYSSNITEIIGNIHQNPEILEGK